MKNKTLFVRMLLLIVLIGLINSQGNAQSCMYSNASTTADLTAMRSTGFTDMIVALWAIQANGDITWGPHTICSDGNYTMGNTLPFYAADMASLKSSGSTIRRLEVGVGGAGNSSYTNIRNLINAQGTGSGSILYRNFRALKNAIPAIDAVNDDDEGTYDTDATIKFAVMLADIGFKYTLAPYTNKTHWQSVVNNVKSQRPGALDRLYLQCYDGGAGNNPCSWNFGVPLYAGLWDYDSDSSIETKLTNWKNSCGIVGGSIWFERTANQDRINYSTIINRVFGVTKQPTTGLVTTYQDSNYTGFSGGFAVGDYNLAALQALGVDDNSITSVKVSQGYKVILYFDDNLTGQSTEITADNGFVGTFNDQVTSLRVRPNGTPNKNGTYFIQNRASGLYIDVDGISTSDGAAIRQHELNNGLNQQFELTDRGDGSYSIAAKHSGKVLDVAGVLTVSGAVIQQWSYLARANQRFILVPTDNGFYKLIAEHDGMVVEVSTNNQGEQLHQWWNHNGANAQWKLVQTILPSTGLVTTYDDCNYTGFSGGLNIGDYNMAALKAKGVLDDAISSLRITQGFQAILYQDDNFTGASTVINSDNSCLNSIWNDKVTSLRVIANGTTTLGNATYFLQNRNSGLNMDVWNASTANGANVAQGTPNTGNNQKFTFTHLSDGLYKIIVNHSGQSLDVNGLNKANGANVEQYPYNGGENQQFVLFSTGDGFYKIVARHSGKIIEVAGASTVNGANVQQWDNNNQICGQWKLVSVTTGRMTSNQAENYADTPNGNNEKFTHMNISPNPTDGRLFFNTDMAGVKVSVFSSTGVLISEQLLTENTLDVSDLKSGFYLILFEKGSANIIQRFVKN